MATIKVKLRPSSVVGRAEAIYYQLSLCELFGRRSRWVRHIFSLMQLLITTASKVTLDCLLLYSRPYGLNTRKCLFWKKVKAIHQTISIDNPYADIKYYEYIQIDKK